MSSIDYINELAARGIELWAQDGKLQYKAPKEAITPALLAELKAHKALLMPLLEQFAGTVGNNPLSYSQTSLWALHQINPESAAYNVTYATQLTDDLDLAALIRCVDGLIARHPILRTRYTVLDGQPTQQVGTGGGVGLSIDRVFGAGEADVLAWIDREANKPFDLSVSPIRLRLLVNEPGSGPVPGLRHALLLNVHHIAADFWSLEIMVRELRTLYGLALRGEPLKLPPLPVQYKDCVHHEAKRLQGPTGGAQAEFWDRELAGDLPVLNLATDHPRPPVKTERGQVHSLPLGTRLSHAVRENAKARHVTPYMLLLGVYQLFLFLHTGQSRLLIGAPTAGRQMPGSEGVLGHFVNTVVLSCQTSADRTFRELLGDTRAMMLRVMDHQDHPFPLLVERLRPARDPSRSPIFQVMYNWNQTRADSLAGQGETGLFGRTLAASSTGTRGATHDLTLNVQDDGHEYVAAWTFNTDLFRPDTVARFAQQYLALVEQVLVEADRPLASYRTTPHAMRSALLERIAQAARQGENGSPLPAALGAVANEQPERVLWSLPGRACRAIEIAQAVAALVGRLSGLGVRARRRVALRQASVAERAIVWLALIEIGADLITDEARAHAVIDTSQGAWDAWSPQALTITTLEAMPDENDAEPSGLFTASQMGQFMDALAHVIGLGDEVEPMLLAGSDETLCSAVMAVSAARGRALHLAAGASVQALAERRPEALAQLNTLIGRLRQPVLVLPDLLLSHLQACDLSSVAIVAVGEHPCALLAPQARAASSLAPTSACFIPRWCVDTWSGPLAFEAAPSQPGAWRVRPWPGHYPVPVLMGMGGDLADEHQAGLLTVLTDRVADLSHAWARPERTPMSVDLAVALVNHRAVETTSIMTRRGGELWSANPSGRTAGHHATPAEIDPLEALMAAQADVAAVACASHDTDEGHQLVCWIVLAGDASSAAVEPALRRGLKQGLPETMHPDAMVFIDHLPLTPDGRLDAARLPQPADRAGLSGVASGEVQHALSVIWREVLALPEVGVHQDFFALGGDSILAAVIVSKAALQGLYFQPRHLFEHSTIASLAEVVSTVPQLVVEQGPVSGEQVVGPASGWFFERVEMDRSHFNQALLLALHQAPDARLMAEALRLLALQHDGLRSRFGLHDGRWRQVFGDDTGSLSPHWSIIDCTDGTGRTCPDRWQEAVASAQACLDIERGPLWGVHWLAGAQLADSRLLVVVHHLLIDGVSWGILLQDLSDIYATLAAGGSPALPLKTTSVKDWVAQWIERSSGDAMQADRDHWQQLARNLVAAPAGWSLSHARVPGGTQVLAAQASPAGPAPCRSVLSLDADLTAAFRASAHLAYGTDANDLLMAALQSGFQAWGGGADLLVDLEGHGRDGLGEAVDMSRSIGWFTSIYPVRLKGLAETDPGRLLKQVKEQLRAIPGKGAGYGVLRHLEGASDAALRATLSAMPPAPLLFTYLGVLDQMAAGASLYTGVIEPAPGIRSPRQGGTHELDMCAYISGERLTLEIAFDGRRLNVDAIDALVRAVRDALAALIRHCLSDEAGGLTPSDLPGMDIDQEGLDALLAEVDALGV